MELKPLILRDGSNFYQQLALKYKTHQKGLFILAPSGAGKTHFCKNQAEPHWIDGDDLWIGAGAHPDGAWWEEPLDVINRVDQRSDLITMEAKTKGFWVMGASNYWLKPDAVVVPDWETHKSYIAYREHNNYDGGAKSDALDQVQSHITVIKKWHTDHGVPLFKTIQAAVDALTA
ncbi:MAG TPA: hypothetical protein VFT49_03280 [Candidatus Saccharimonadales bacterium]|nr:hypothetical protein [Candidatus Saccharimonadales bacterium]